MLQVVWDGARDDPKSNGGYLNVEFYPKREAPALPPRYSLPRTGVGSHAKVWEALAAAERPARPPKPPRKPNNTEKKEAFHNCLSLLIAQLRQRPLTIAEMQQVTRKRYWNVRHCLTLLRHMGILRSKPVGATGGRPTQTFWIE